MGKGGKKGGGKARGPFWSSDQERIGPVLTEPPAYPPRPDLEQLLQTPRETLVPADVKLIEFNRNLDEFFASGGPYYLSLAEPPTDIRRLHTSQGLFSMREDFMNGVKEMIGDAYFPPELLEAQPVTARAQERKGHGGLEALSKLERAEGQKKEVNKE